MGNKKGIRALVLSVLLIASARIPAHADAAALLKDNGETRTAAPVLRAALPTRDTRGVRGSALVVYYSYSGNTKRVAERLAGILGADCYEIRTARPYPDDPHETAAISRRERDGGNLPALMKGLPSLTGYTTIYVGGPVWNSYMPTPLESYLKVADFSGKTVVPFSTSMGSGQAGYLKDFKKHARNPEKIAEYMDIQFPNNGRPDAFTNSEIDDLLGGWLAKL